jgi:hypothetical protein
VSFPVIDHLRDETYLTTPLSTAPLGDVRIHRRIHVAYAGLVTIANAIYSSMVALDERYIVSSVAIDLTAFAPLLVV